MEKREKKNVLRKKKIKKIINKKKKKILKGVVRCLLSAGFSRN